MGNNTQKTPRVEDKQTKFIENKTTNKKERIIGIFNNTINSLKIHPRKCPQH